MLDELAKIAPLAGAFGQLLGGIGVVIAAITALVTLLRIQQRTLDNQWIDGFRQTYAEFWKDGTITKVRMQIVNDQEYRKLEAILAKRLARPTNDLDPEENETLECVDKFCALMYRITTFASGRMTESQRDVLEYFYHEYWFPKMLGCEQFRQYIKRFWSRLDDDAEEWLQKLQAKENRKKTKDSPSVLDRMLANIRRRWWRNAARAGKPRN